MSIMPRIAGGYPEADTIAFYDKDIHRLHTLSSVTASGGIHGEEMRRLPLDIRMEIDGAVRSFGHTLPVGRPTHYGRM
jgi:hypothetical protein